MIQLKPSVLKSKVSNDASEIRDLKGIINNLYKEIERKDNRNDLLSKDIVNLRSSLSNHERELRILSNTLDHINSDKLKLTNELNKYRELYTKTNEQLNKYINPNDIIQSYSSIKLENEQLNKQYSEACTLIKQKDEYIQSIEDEIQILKRTINIQSTYNNQNSNHKDIIKSLYYELGKEQSKSHNLSIQCSKQFHEIETLQNKIELTNNMKLDITNKLNTLSLTINQLNNELNENKEVINNYMLNNERLTNDNNILLDQLDKYTNLNNQHEQLVGKYNHTIKQLDVTSLLNKNLEIKYSELNDKHNQLVNNYNELDKLNNELQSDKQNILDNNIKYNDEINNLRSLLDNVTNISSELTRKNNNLTVDYKQLEKSFNNLTNTLKQNEITISNQSNSISNLTNERDEAIYGLKESIDKLKDLSMKNEALVKENKEIKEKLVALQQAKEHVSVAVLDALYKERNKNRKLEKVIQDFNNSASPISSGSTYEGTTDHLDSKTNDSNNTTTLEKLATMSPHAVSSPTDPSPTTMPTTDNSADQPKSAIIGELFRLRDTLQRIEEKSKSISTNNTPYTTTNRAYDTPLDDSNNINRDLFYN